MRIILTAALLTTASLCAASNYREVSRAVNDDRMLESAGVAPAETQMRAQCSAAVVETDDPPEFFDCVYVQTAKGVDLFSLEDGYLMSELQLKLSNIDAVALQRLGKFSQVQIWSGDRVTALYIHDKSWIDPRQTESVYRWLLEQGVAERSPQRWIGR